MAVPDLPLAGPDGASSLPAPLHYGPLRLTLLLRRTIQVSEKLIKKVEGMGASGIIFTVGESHPPLAVAPSASVLHTALKIRSRHRSRSRCSWQPRARQARQARDQRRESRARACSAPIVLQCSTLTSPTSLALRAVRRRRRPFDRHPARQEPRRGPRHDVVRAPAPFRRPSPGRTLTARDPSACPSHRDDVAWLKSITSLPVIVKGVQDVEDVALAAKHGADAVVLSNHGGRCESSSSCHPSSSPSDRY